MAQELDTALLAICKQINVPEQFQMWLREKAKVYGVDGVALMAVKEENIGEDIFAPAASDGCKLEAMHEKVAVSKLWTLCRKGKEAGNSLPSAQGGEPIPEASALDIKDAWRKAHDFELLDSMLLIGTLEVNFGRVSCCRGRSSIVS